MQPKDFEISAQKYVDQVDREIIRIGIKKAEVARQCGMTKQTLYKILNHNRKGCRLSTFLNIVDSIGCDVRIVRRKKWEDL